MEKPNILIIVCDTLRKDVLDLYGGPAKMPNIAKLAKDAMVYQNCIAPSPWTFPSHVSLFTGMYPHEHGVHETSTAKTAECIDLNARLGAIRMPEYLRRLNYNCIGISNNLMVSRFAHFDIGFNYFVNVETNPWLGNKDIEEVALLGPNLLGITKALIKQGKFAKILNYTSEFIRIKSNEKSLNFPLDKGAAVTNKLLKNSKLEENFFVFINYFDVHEPYKGENRKKRWESDAGIKQMDQAMTKLLKSQYISEAEYLDKRLGEVFQMLKDRGLYENTMIIITSDHGQAFNEHGFLYHGIYLYDELVRVPLIIKYPQGKKFRKRDGYQSLANIFNLVKDVVEGKGDSRVTTSSVFTEAYGDEHIRRNMPKNYAHRIPYVLDKYEKVRKAVYRNGFKLVFNYTDNRIEEMLKHGKPVNPDNYKKQAKALMAELKSK